MRKSVYSLILTTFFATTSFAGDRSDDLLSSESPQSTHSVVPILGDQNTGVAEIKKSTKPKLRRTGSGDRGGCASSRGLTRANFKAQQEESKTKPTHRRRPSGDKGGNGGGGNGGDRGGFSAKLVQSHAEFAAKNAKPELKKVPSGHHGESAEKPKLKRVPSGHHGESAENPKENSNAFFEYAYQQSLLSQAPLVETY